MSSMVRNFLNSHRIYAATLGLGVIWAAGAPAAAQDFGGNDLVARQPAAIDSAIARWETLQASRTNAFADYAGFALAYPSFPRADILRARAEAALEVEAPSQFDVLRFFDANPPLTNAGRGRYALTGSMARSLAPRITGCGWTRCCGRARPMQPRGRSCTSRPPIARWRSLALRCYAVRDLRHPV